MWFRYLHLFSLGEVIVYRSLMDEAIGTIMALPFIFSCAHQGQALEVMASVIGEWLPTAGSNGGRNVGLPIISTRLNCSTFSLPISITSGTGIVTTKTTDISRVVWGFFIFLRCLASNMSVAHLTTVC